MKFNRYVFCNTLVFLLTAIPLAVFGQENLSKNNLSIGTINQLSTNTITEMDGTERMLQSYGVAHSLALNYTRKFNDFWSMTAGWGFGAYPLFYKIQESSTLSIQKKSYFLRTSYTGFNRLASSINYNFTYNDLWNGRFYVGFGVWHFRDHGLGTSGDNYFIEFKYNDIAKPFAIIGKEFYKILNSKNELVIKLGYHYSFRNIYTLKYQLNTNSTGTLINSGSNFNCSVFYRFTGQKKKNKVSELESQGKSNKQTKKIASKEKRYFDPKSYFVSFYGGMGFGINKSDNIHFLSNSQPSFSGRITLEKGFANKLFVETGLHGLEYYSTLGVNGSTVSSFSNVVLPIFISIGGGYRFITNDHFKLFNLHTGISVGFHDRPKGITSISKADTNNEPGYITMYNWNYHNIFMNLYAGISKDFKLTERIFISINYRYQIGLYPVIQGRIKHYSNQPVRKGNINIDGSAHHYELGLKYRFDQFKRKNK